MRLPQDHRCAARDRLTDEFEAMALLAGQREEQTPRACAAAVQGQIRDARLAARHFRDAIEKPHERCGHCVSFACTSEAAGTFCKSSGGTSIKRSVPDITLANTGA